MTTFGAASPSGLETASDYTLHPSGLHPEVRWGDWAIGIWWVMELEEVITRHQDILTSDEVTVLKGFMEQWQEVSSKGKSPGGLVVKE